MIRAITKEELPLIVSHAEDFFEESKHPGKFNAQHFLITWKAIFEAKVGKILCLFDDNGDIIGGIGIIVSPDMNTGDLVATEVFWFVDKNKRKGRGALRLLKQMWETAETMGAKRIIMVHLAEMSATILRKLYKRHGFIEIETHYMKEV